VKTVFLETCALAYQMLIKIVVSDATLIYKNRHYLIGATTFSKVTLGMMTLSMTVKKEALRISLVLCFVVLFYHYAKCHRAECHYQA
jgi:hypothetical protein